jgi:hypothetical protein
MFHFTKPWLSYEPLSVYRTDPVFMTPPKVIPRFSRNNPSTAGFIYDICNVENLDRIIDVLKAKLRSAVITTSRGVFVKSANGLVYYLHVHNEKIFLYKVRTRANPHVTYMVDTYGMALGSSHGVAMDRKRHVIMGHLLDPSDSPDWWVEHELNEAFL